MHIFKAEMSSIFFNLETKSKKTCYEI